MGRSSGRRQMSYQNIEKTEYDSNREFVRSGEPEKRYSTRQSNVQVRQPQTRISYSKNRKEGRYNRYAVRNVQVKQGKGKRSGSYATRGSYSGNRTVSKGSSSSSGSYNRSSTRSSYNRTSTSTSTASRSRVSESGSSSRSSRAQK